MLYCLAVWGGAVKRNLKPVETTMKKCWRSMGKYKQHTLNKLQELKIPKLEDEIDISETKIIWRWENNKIPKSLKDLITEKQDNLRGRRFVIPRQAKPENIVSRLAKRATNSISSLMPYRTKKSLVFNLKKRIVDNNYTFQCRRRDCFICSR